MRFGWQFHIDRVAGAHLSARDDDAHYARLAPGRATAVATHDLMQQARPKAIDLETGIAQSCYLDDRRRPQPQSRSGRKLEQRDTARRDVLPQLTRTHREAGRGELVVQLGVNEVHLPEIRLRRIARQARAMLYGDAEMGVAIDAQAFNQSNRRLILLAERVRIASRDGDDRCAHAFFRDAMLLARDRDHRASRALEAWHHLDTGHDSRHSPFNG